jgi:hypothetical protein
LPKTTAEADEIRVGVQETITFLSILAGIGLAGTCQIADCQPGLSKIVTDIGEA